MFSMGGASRASQLSSSLVAAVLDGNASSVKALLKQGADPCTRIPNGPPLPVYAAGYGNLQVLQLLAENKRVKADKQLALGMLVAATERKQVQVVEWLLKKKISLSVINGLNLHGKHSLLLAIEANDTRLAQVLMTHGADTNFRMSDGTTMLHWAVLADSREVVRLLASWPRTELTPDASGLTALHIAAGQGNAQALQILLGKFGDKVDAPLADGRTPLALAVANDHAEAACVLLAHRAGGGQRGGGACMPGGRTPLAFAVERRAWDMAMALVQRGRADPAQRDARGSTPFHVACTAGHAALATAMMASAKGVCKVLDASSMTGLHIAAKLGHAEVVAAILGGSNSPGEVAKLQGPGGHTAAHFAVAGDHVACIAQLAKAGPKACNVPNGCGDTPLHLAVQQGRLECAKALVRTAGVDPGKQSPHLLATAVASDRADAVACVAVDLQCPLAPTPMTGSGLPVCHAAAAQGRHDLLAGVPLPALQRLLAARSKPDGSTALHLAAERGQVETVGFLVRQCGQEVDARDDQKQTPLHRAVLGCHAGVVYVLAELGAGLEARRKDGRTPIELALSISRPDIVDAITAAAHALHRSSASGAAPSPSPSRGTRSNRSTRTGVDANTLFAAENAGSASLRHSVPTALPGMRMPALASPSARLASQATLDRRAAQMHQEALREAAPSGSGSGAGSTHAAPSTPQRDAGAASPPAVAPPLANLRKKTHILPSGCVRLVRPFARGHGLNTEMWLGELVAADGAHEVAVKRFDLGAAPTEAARFHRELAALRDASERCPRSCRLLGLARDGSRMLLVMQLYGASVLEVLEGRGGGLPAALFLHYGAELARAVHELHSVHLMHFDIKPSNVLLDERGQLVLCDFGLCVRDANALRESEDVWGTIGYAPPECIDLDQRHKACQRSDCWALAVTLLHMRTGRDPWAPEGGAAAAQWGDLLQRVGLRKESPPIPAGLPPRVEDVLKRCFLADPWARPSAEAVAAAFDDAARDLGARPTPPDLRALVAPASIAPPATTQPPPPPSDQRAGAAPPARRDAAPSAPPVPTLAPPPPSARAPAPAPAAASAPPAAPATTTPEAHDPFAGSSAEASGTEATQGLAPDLADLMTLDVRKSIRARSGQDEGSSSASARAGDAPEAEPTDVPQVEEDFDEVLDWAIELSRAAQPAPEGAPSAPKPPPPPLRPESAKRPAAEKVRELCLLARFGEAEEVEKRALKDPALGRMRDARGWTAVHHAAHAGQAVCLARILAACPEAATGASAKLGDGTTPLHLAVLSKSIQTVRALISTAPSLVTMSNAAGFAPVHLAADLGQADIVLALASAKSECLLLRDTNGRTALHYCAQRAESTDALMAVLERFRGAGAQRRNIAALLSARDGAGETAEDVAAAAGRQNVAQALRAEREALVA